jgi:two-component system, cell cycle sensor histidine kinase and response regulator CckA
MQARAESLRGVTVLIAAGDDTIAADLRELLTRHGMQVVASAGSAESCVRDAEEQRPALLLLSAELKLGASGFAVAAQLHDTSPVPIVLFVTPEQWRAVPTAVDAKIYGYAFKPLVEAQLLATLQLALHRIGDGAESRFRTLVDHATDAFYLVDERGRILDVNAQALRDVRYAKSELIDLVHLVPTLFNESAENFATQIRRGELFALDVQCRRKDASSFPVEVRVRPVRENGALQAVCLARDITERVRVERQLREGEQKFRAIFDQTFQFTGLLTIEGILVDANRSALEFAGIPEAQVIGRPFWETPWWSHSLALQQQLKDAIAEAAQGRFVRFEVTHPASNGELHTVDFSLKPVKDDSGKVVLLIPEGRDITERKLAEDNLRQSEAERQKLQTIVLRAQKLEAVGKLAAGIAHDFNNLLTVVSGCTELLISSNLDPASVEMVEEIKDAGTRAARLTSQLLAFSRQQVLQPRLLDLGQLVSDISRMLERILGEDVVLTRVSAAGLWPIVVDPGQIEQVIVNLAVNARDAMPRGGKLLIETENIERDATGPALEDLAPGRYVALVVRDSGLGMDAATRERIFEPFFTTKELGKGTGLGLATVYGIVRQSGGAIVVDSTPTRGTTFRLLFPAAPPTATALQLPKPATKPKARGTESVLLVEDDDAVRTVTAGALRGHGYTVYEAASGEAALRLVGEHPSRVQLVVTDVVMPGMSGREIVERVQALAPKVRVLYVSGYPDDAMVRHGIVDGDVAFLHKPFAPSVLAERVRSVLDRQ